MNDVNSGEISRVFYEAYVAWRMHRKRFSPATERAFRYFQRWIEKEIDQFEKLPPAKRWQKIECQSRPESEIPFLNDSRGLFVFGPFAERARQASITFKRKARGVGNGGYRIGRRHIGPLTRELRAAGCYGRLYGLDAAFFDGNVERISHRERAANAFGEWACKRMMREPKDVSICREISNTLERSHNALRGRGFKHVEDIFEHAWTGRMAQRFGPAKSRRNAPYPNTAGRHRDGRDDTKGG